MDKIENIKNIAVYRAGLLGDTLVAIPALWCLRESYPGAKIVYIWQKSAAKHHITAREVLEGTGLVDEFICDELSESYYKRILSFIKNWWTLKKRKLDIGIVLEEPHWSNRRKFLFRACGSKVILGPDGRGKQIERDAFGNLPKIKHISDSLIDVLRPLNISLPDPLKAKTVLPRSDIEKKAVDRWLLEIGLNNNNARWVAISPWSNMSLKRWPIENYSLAVNSLIREFNIIPFVLGGREEREIADKLIKEWNCGYAVTGELSIKDGIELLSRCKMYLGNDTGTMHMAVAAGIPCVTIFSARDMPGRWEPYGTMHTVFRADVDCAGCMLRECKAEGMKCILSIDSMEVIEACRKILCEVS